MKKIKLVNKIVLLVGLLSFTQTAFSQKKIMKQLSQQRYHEIVNANQGKTKAIKKGYVYQRALAYSFAQMAMSEKAYDAYFELIEKYPSNIDDVDRLQFALVARQMELYGISDSLLLQLKGTSYTGIPLFEELTDDFYITNKEKRSDYWEEFNFQDNYVFKKIPQSTKVSEYALVPDGKGNAFFSQQKSTGLWKIITAVQGQPYHKIIFARYSDSSIIFPEVMKFNKSRTNQHISYVDQVNGWMYLTRNVCKKNSKNEKVLEVVALRKDRKNKSKWIEVPFQLNNKNYSVADLVISPDGSKAIFSSDMPGGYGKSDLYEAPVLENNENGLKLGTPVNMGPLINTALRDNFPRFSDSGDFFFSSEGHLGFGGLDIYTIDKNSSMILNLGKPINSPFDDYAPQFHEKWGTISSNRNGGGNNDDLYFMRWFEDNKTQKEPTQEGVIVQVIDEETGLPMPNVDVAIDNLDDLDNAIPSKTDSLGRVLYDKVPKIAKVQATSHPCGYKYATSQEFSVNPEGKRVVTLGVQKYKVGEDLGVLFDVKPIYYESSSYDLTQQSKEELDRVVIVLKDNEGLLVELGAHTDSRGSDDFNMMLSDYRAKSVYNYLVSKGIAEGRLKFKGYGETKILNRCFNGIDCADQEHQVNRRTEYLIYGVRPCGKTIKGGSTKNAIAANDKKAGKKSSSKKSDNTVASSGKDNSSNASPEESRKKHSFTKADLEQNDMATGDADGDGIPDYLDPDSDNDRIPDAAEGRKDSDGDGLPNFIDKDSDNDGIPDSVEGGADTDKDTKGNYIDTDSDNDGIKDEDEGVEDADNDGKPNYIDSDSDNDGISDRNEGTKDTDNDGSPNFLDLDSDGDGIEDSDEGTKDSDADGKPNYLDTDSDNDGISDKIEGTKDSDNDKKPDYIDTDSDEDGIPDKFESAANYKNYPTEVKPIEVKTPHSDSKAGSTDVNGSNESDVAVDMPAPEDNKVKASTSKPANNSVNTSNKEVYRVQVMMSAKSVDKATLANSGLKDVFVYQDNGYFKYCTGKSFENESDAEAEKVRLRANGFKDAFVVKFVGNKRVK